MALHKLKYYRSVLELTQDEMAEELGISLQAYANIEKETSNVKLSRMLAIQKIINDHMTKSGKPEATLDDIFGD